MRSGLVSITIIVLILSGFSPVTAQNDKVITNWSLERDLSFFNDFEFDSILFYHGLKPLIDIDNIALSFSETPVFDTRKWAEKNKDIITDSLEAVKDERDRLYLEAYFNWLLLFIDEKVSNQNLYYAAKTLQKKYPCSPHNLLFRRRTSEYFYNSSPAITVKAGLGWGFFTKDIREYLNSHSALEFGLGVKFGKTTITFMINHQAGYFTDDFQEAFKNERFDYLYDIERDGYTLIGFKLAGYHCIYENNHLSISPMLGMKWLDLEFKKYHIPSSTDAGPTGGIKFEYTLGVSESSDKGSFLFGLLKYNSIVYTVIKAYIEIDIAYNKYGFIDKGEGLNCNIIAGISVYTSDKDIKK